MVKNYYIILKQIKNIRFYKLEMLGDISPSFCSPSFYIDGNILWKDIIKKLHGAIYQQCDYQVKVNGKTKGLSLFLFLFLPFSTGISTQTTINKLLLYPFLYMYF